MQITRMDKLGISTRVDGDAYDQNELRNRRVTAIVKNARGQTFEFTGKVVFTDPNKGLSGDYAVIAEVDNRRSDDGSYWLLTPGSAVDMQVHFDDDGANPIVQSADNSFSIGSNK